ncbi:hypothetical protein ABEB36_007770 [Hypothenemus hampei]|uniref:BLOC-1-related complex subunit 7 n=1 Tax=Hypothenemus hampei TaxID=57062 RepID=A0ABD1EZ00_HYPHA
MASASSTSARSLFQDSKVRLADRVQVNVNNVAAVARQIMRGSKTQEILMHSARNYASQEIAIENSENNLKRLQALCAHIGLQQEALEKRAGHLDDVKEQVQAMQR